MWAKARSLRVPIGLLFLVGCTYPVRQQVDTLICERSSLSHDLAPADEDKPDRIEKAPKKDGAAADKDGVQPAQLLLTQGQDQPKKPNLEQRLLDKTEPSSSIPGSTAPNIKLNPNLPTYKEKIKEVIDQNYKPAPPLPIDKDFPAGPNGAALTLADLEHIAYTNSPLLRQAASDIEAARGAAIQAGAYPNPTLTYNAVGVGPSGGPTVGGSIGFTIKTMGKLKLAQAAALENLKAYEFAYRRAETDMMWNVRTNYYNVLVAQESLRANRGLVELTDEVYRVMIDLLRAGEGVSPSYEPAQMAVFTEQARTALVIARNQRLLAWRQLAASMGVPEMPPTLLTGNVHVAVPHLDWEKSLAHVLSKHTDVLTTATAIDQARYNLRLAQVTPIPDLAVSVGMLSDLTLPGPYRDISQVSVTIPVPVFDQNKGAIRQSQAALVRAMEEPHRVRASLTATFADAYRRYEENRVLLEMYQKSILPKQVQSFRGAVKINYGAVGIVAFTDLISAEQNLITTIGAYLPILAAQWQAVADVSSWLQTDEVYAMVDQMNTLPAVDFDELLKLPCHHPCSPHLPPGSLLPPPEAGSLTESPKMPMPAKISLSANPVAFGPVIAATASPDISPSASNVAPAPQLNQANISSRDAIRANFGPSPRYTNAD